MMTTVILGQEFLPVIPLNDNGVLTFKENPSPTSPLEVDYVMTTKKSLLVRATTILEKHWMQNELIISILLEDGKKQGVTYTLHIHGKKRLIQGKGENMQAVEYFKDFKNEGIIYSYCYVDIEMVEKFSNF